MSAAQGVDIEEPVEEPVAEPSEALREQSRAVMERHARTFSLAARFLPPAARDDAALLYAFCRRVDDIADEDPDPEHARALLRGMQADLRAGRSEDPDVRALLSMSARQDLPLEAAIELIEGACSDLRPRLRIADDAELLLYAYRVAGTVGLLMSRLIGVRDEAALPHAVDLGIAMQITNICRDVLEDAGRDRVYLPASRLLAAGVEPAALARGEVDGGRIAPVVRDLLDLAERYYASAERGMIHIPWRSRVAIRIASRVYRAIGRRLRARGCDPLQGRTVVPFAMKAAWTLQALATSLLPGWPLRSRHEARLHRLLPSLPGANPSAPS